MTSENEKKYYTNIQHISKVLMVMFFIIVSLTVLYPMVYVVSGSVAPGNSIADMDPKPFARGVTWAHFKYLFNQTQYGLWFLNTLKIAVSTSVITMIITSLSAYIFSRFRFSIKKPMLMSLLILQVFPSFVGMIAIYVIIQRIGGFDTLWGLVLVYIAGNIPYDVWMVKSYIDTIPKSLDEAARIDGASHFRIWATIVMPVAKPIITFLGITTFTGPWMDFIFPKMILRSPEKQTLALGLFSFVTDKKNEFTTFAAGSIIIAIPFVIFFIFTQKAMMMSMGAGAVKE
ncbi:MAG: sugar ABC transporter permease [Treponemataceae bacterium]|nr:sugar ABC transporter permease [Treponema sp.]MDE6068483.1 sugar ABC transporter permease [Treponemataceae bacterium]